MRNLITLIGDNKLSEEKKKNVLGERLSMKNVAEHMLPAPGNKIS